MTIRARRRRSRSQKSTSNGKSRFHSRAGLACLFLAAAGTVMVGSFWYARACGCVLYQPGKKPPPVAKRIDLHAPPDSSGIQFLDEDRVGTDRGSKNDAV